MSKILVIEDDKLILKSLIIILNSEGFETISAENGLDGIELALSESPDLVLSDINLKDISGMEVFNSLRKDSRTISSPFIFISGMSEIDDIRKGMSLGADDYIVKPFKQADVVNSIKARLHKKAENDNILIMKFENFRKSISKMIPHEMRTPLTGILGLSDFLINDIDNLKKEEIVEILNHLNNSAKRLNNVIIRYINYSKILIELGEKESYSKGEITITKESIEHIIYEIAKQFDFKNNFNFDLLEYCDLNITKEYFKILLEELIDNAIKFASLDSDIICKTFVKDNYFHLYVKNEGRGINKSEIKEIGAFIQFKRDIFEQQGLGLGLSLVKMIIELHSGEFEILSENESSVEVTIKLPLGETNEYQ